MKIIQYIGERNKDTNPEREWDYFRDYYDTGYINADHVEKVVVDDYVNIPRKLTYFHVGIYTTNRDLPYIFFSQCLKHGDKNEENVEEKVGLVCSRLARTLAAPGDELIIGGKEDYILSSSTTPQQDPKTRIHYLYDYETGEEGFL